MITPPEIATLEAQTTAVIRLLIPAAQCQTEFGPAVGELLGELTKQGIQPQGPLFDHHFQAPSEVFDFEIGFPVAARVQPSSRVAPSERKAQCVAKTVFTGPYEQLADAWGQLMAWMEGEGLSPGRELWQIFRKGPESTPNGSEWETELIRPINDSQLAKNYQ